MPDQFDYEDALTLARAERKAVLKRLIPEEENPIPPGYGRCATVRIRRVNTGTASTPAVIACFLEGRHPTGTHHGEDRVQQDQSEQDGMYQTGKISTCEQLLWDCKQLQADRVVAFRTLPLTKRSATYPE